MASLTNPIRAETPQPFPKTTLRANAPEFVPQSSEAKAAKETASKTHYYYLCTSSLLKESVRVEYATGKIEIVGNEATLRFRSREKPPNSDFYNAIKREIYTTRDQFTENTYIQNFYTTPPLDVRQPVLRVVAYIHSKHSPFDSRICVALGELCKSFPNMDPTQSEVRFFCGPQQWTLNSVLSR